MNISKDSLSQEQLDAIGKWRWLGWSGSTPAFKASLALLAVLAIVLLAVVVIQ